MITKDEQNQALIKLGTLSHNRSFKRDEWFEYGGSAEQLKWLQKNNLIYQPKPKEWYPTGKGWDRLDALVESLPS